jgi:hypothetical protein
MRQLLCSGALLAAVIASPAAAADKIDIDNAITRGVEALQKIQAPDGTWAYSAPNTTPGSTALAGLALLECGVAKDSLCITKAAAYLRGQSATLRHTYSVSLALIFFDRLGDPADLPIIESLAARLVGGQNPGTGAWAYWCPELVVAEQRRLNELVTQARGDSDSAPTKVNPADFRNRVALLNPASPNMAGPGLARPDNSNTQFALLALWVARRHGFPVDTALRAGALHFRNTQSPADAGWSYEIETSGTTRATMTCAGILGIAVGYGILNDKAKEKGKTGSDISKDMHLQAALRTLSLAIGTPLERRPNEAAGAGGGLGDPGRVFPVPAGQQPALLLPQQASAGGKAFYFLWSVERVAMVLNLETINRKDWYGWGSDVLMATQKPNGTWEGEYGQGGVDTSFALLFLKKANFASDLSKLTGRIDDGHHVLKGTESIPGVQKSPPSAQPGDDMAKPAAPVAATPKPRTRPASLGDTAGAKMAEKLLDMAAAQQPAEIQRLRDAKGGDNTEALATAIPYLSTIDTRNMARDALAQRLARMSDETIHGDLQDELPEIRRAAAIACAMKPAKQFVPDLIAMLSDPEKTVARAAYFALKDISSEDFGPPAEADAATIKRSAAQWQAWWKKQKSD